MKVQQALFSALCAFALLLLFQACIPPSPSPDPGSAAGIEWIGISKTKIDVRTAAVNVGMVSLSAPAAGYAKVSFTGTVVCSPGDDIVLAASDVSQNWLPNDGCVAVSCRVDATQSPFSHTRVYQISGAGTYNYYAVVQNYVETGGNGIASIYGTLTAEFFPKRY